MKAPQNVSGDRDQQHRSSSPFFPGQQGRPSFFKPVIQPKLSINPPNDPYEQEADRMADQVMAEAPSIQRMCTDCEEEAVMRKEEGSGIPVPDQLESGLNGSKGSGAALPEGTRGSMEKFFNRDLSSVRVHTDEQAVQMSRDIQAKAFTHGSDIYFNEGQYAPESNSGKHLLAHELTHTVQQNGGAPANVQRYTDEEILAMKEFQEEGQENDIAMANDRKFVPGDIVFRLGSAVLGLLTGLPVTHGGIYIGDGLIHDVVGFGNRFVRVTNFFSKANNEAKKEDVFRVIRFVGPLKEKIIERLLLNIADQDFRMPTGDVPFNLFSSADNYETATCLEYAHAQYLYAIHDVSVDPRLSPIELLTLRATYFKDNDAAEPENLIAPQEQTIVGYTIANAASGRPGAMERTASAGLMEAGLIAEASRQAKNVDPEKFKNSSESTYEMKYPGGPGVSGHILNMFAGPLYDIVRLNTFTYKSFLDSSKFFKEMTLPDAPKGSAKPSAKGVAPWWE